MWSESNLKGHKIGALEYHAVMESFAPSRAPQFLQFYSLRGQRGS